MIGSVGKTFGELVRAARESQDMKSYRLAELIDRRPSLISRIENGDYKETPPPEIIAGLSEALGIPQYQLLRAIGYGVGPVEADAREYVDSVRAGLIDRIARIRLNDDRVGVLESILDRFIRLDRKASEAVGDSATPERDAQVGGR